MRHVDALSRSVAYVNEVPLERELKLRQLADSRIQEIADDLKYNKNEKFALIDGLVYKKDNRNLKFVVPDIIISAILRVYIIMWHTVVVKKPLKGLLRHTGFLQ